MASSMTRADLIALAARAEQAQGPDRALDADITLAVNPELGAAPWERITYPSGGASVFADRSDPDNLNVVSPPRFTASLDAALTLVPEGWTFTVHSGDDRGPPVAYCVPNMGRLPWPHWVDDINAATPALALCAAALRARAEEGNDG